MPRLYGAGVSWHAPFLALLGMREMSAIIRAIAVNGQSLNCGSPRVWLQSSRRKAPAPRVAEAGCPCRGSKNFPQSSAFVSCELINLTRSPSVNRRPQYGNMEARPPEMKGLALGARAALQSWASYCSWPLPLGGTKYSCKLNFDNSLSRKKSEDADYHECQPMCQFL